MTTITLIAGGYSEASRLTALIQKADAYCHPRHINFQVVQVHQLNAEGRVASHSTAELSAASLLDGQDRWSGGSHWLGPLGSYNKAENS